MNCKFWNSKILQKDVGKLFQFRFQMNPLSSYDGRLASFSTNMHTFEAFNLKITERGDFQVTTLEKHMAIIFPKNCFWIRFVDNLVTWMKAFGKFWVQIFKSLKFTRLSYSLGQPLATEHGWVSTSNFEVKSDGQPDFSLIDLFRMKSEIGKILKMKTGNSKLEESSNLWKGFYQMRSKSDRN